MNTLRDLALATGWEYDPIQGDAIVCHWDREISIEYATGVAGNKGLFYFYKRDEYLTLSYETVLAIAKDLNEQISFAGKLLPLDDVRKLARDIWALGKYRYCDNVGFVVDVPSRYGFAYEVSYEYKPVTDRDFDRAVVNYTRIYDVENSNA